jgi:hypothetical protein
MSATALRMMIAGCTRNRFEKKKCAHWKLR